MRVLFIIAVIIYLFSPGKVFAAALTNTIPSQSSTYQVNDEITVHTVLDINADDGTAYYLQGLFYKSGTSNYCGSTWNGSSYYNGSTSGGGHKQLYKIAVTSDKWEGDPNFKIDTSDSGCKETGEYKLKIKRFTEAGSDSIDDQNELSINFNIPATPTPVQPTATPTPTTSASSSTTTPTSTPTPTSTIAQQSTTSTPTPTKKPTVTPTVKPVADDEATMEATMMSTNADVPQQEVKGAGIELGGKLDDLAKKETQYNWAKLLILMGAVLVTCACGVLVYNNYLKDKLEEMRSQ